MSEEEEILQVAKDVGAGFPDSLYGRTDYCVMTKYELLKFTRAIEAKAVAKEREDSAKFFDMNDANLFWGSVVASHIRARGA